MSGLSSLAHGAPRDARAVMASRDPGADNVDFFPTPPWGARAGAELIRSMDPQARTCWEPAAGAGHMAHGLRESFETVFESDAYDYGRGASIFDFARPGTAPFQPDWIVTNPPFAMVEPFVRLGYARARRGVALLMRLAVLEGQARYRLLHEDVPLHATAPFSERLAMHKGRWDPSVSTASAYAWFFWLKPVAGGPRRYAKPIPAPRLLRIAPGAQKRLERASDRAFAVGGQL